MITIGPHCIVYMKYLGYMNICMLSTFIGVSFFLIYFIKGSDLMQVFKMIMSALLIISYLLCSLVNPGIASAKAEPVDNENLFCEV